MDIYEKIAKFEEEIKQGKRRMRSTDPKNPLEYRKLIMEKNEFEKNNLFSTKHL